MGGVAESEVFHVARDYAYHGLLLFFQGPNNHSQFVGKGRCSEPELQDVLRSGGPVVTEWDYPRRFTVDRLNGPVIVRTAIDFLGLASRTVLVTWNGSLQPQNFFGSVLTAIPRLRMRKGAPGIRANLWRIKVDLEGHAFDHVMEHILPPDHLAQLDPPEGIIRTVTDAAVWHRGITLLEGAGYCEVLREVLGPAAEHFNKLAEELESTARFYLSLCSAEGMTEDYVDMAKREYVDNFARLAESEQTHDHELLSSMMLYFMSLKKNVRQIAEDAPRLHEQAKGNRGVMAKLLLEYASPDFNEMARIARGMPERRAVLPLREWATQRRSDAVTNQSHSSPIGAASMKEIQLSCAWCDSETLMNELKPYIGHIVRLEVRNQGPRFRGAGVDSTILVALIAGGSAVLSALITALIRARPKKETDEKDRMVLKGASGVTVEVTGAVSEERLREIIEAAKTLDRPQIYIE